METIIHKQRSNLAMHKQSRTISKSKPKIRIIHIFAPEIIKTDAANFRELVQRLTGKPDDEDDQQRHHHHNHRHLRHRDHQKGSENNPRSRDHHHQVHDMTTKPPIFHPKNTYPENVFRTNLDAATAEEEEVEEEITWSDNGGNSNSGGFLNSLGDLDGFIQELGEFSYLPLATMDATGSSSSSSSHNMHGGFVESEQFAI